MVGDDTIFADDINSYRSEVNENTQGNWVLGGTGNDKIFGSARKDLLQAEFLVAFK